MVNDRLAATLLDASPDGLLVVDADGVVTIANAEAGRLFGIPSDELVGSPIERLVPIEDRERHVALRSGYVTAPGRRGMGAGPRLLAEHSDGTLFPVEVSLSPVQLDDALLTIATIRDVSQRRADAAKLELLIDRERIARDLHDMVIQRIFGAGLSLQAVVSAAPPMVAERIGDVIDELDETIRELRGAIFRLSERPADVSLSDRVHQIVAERSRALSFEPEVTVDEAIDSLGPELGEELIATLGEAMSNVVRHAQATACEVSVRFLDDLVRLTVVDNGVGVPSKLEHRGGLVNMLDRASLLGGTCTIGAMPSGGTEVDWSVPV